MANDEFKRYVILLTNDSGKSAPDQAIKLHIAFLRDLEARGKLVLCGPFADYRGGMLIVKSETRDEAESIAKSDPYIVGGHRSYEIRTWLLSCEENNHLGRG